MAKHDKPKLTADEIRELLAGSTLDETNRQKLHRELKALESAADATRIAVIRETFGMKHDAARDHCISQGIAADVAEDAFRRLESKLGWRSPAGGVFGREPDDEKSIGTAGRAASEAVTPVPAAGPGAAPTPQGSGA